MDAPPRYAFALCGSRGDVEACAHVATALARLTHTTVTLATHAAHRGWLGDAVDVSHLRLVWLSALPAGVWEGVAAAASPAAAAAAQAALEGELVAALAGHTAGVAFNLFAMEAFHIAEAMGVPAIAVAPYPMPHACPRGLRAGVEGAHPAVAAALVCCATPRHGGGPPAAPPSCCWCLVSHWAYALVNERRWGALRARLGALRARLVPAVAPPAAPGPPGLPPLPFGAPGAEAPPLLYGFSAGVLPPDPTWLPLASVCDGARQSVSLTGYWRRRDRTEDAAPPHAPPAVGDAPLGVTWGSMTSLGAVRPPGRDGEPSELGGVLRVVAGACRALGRHAVVVVPGGMPAGVALLHLGGGWAALQVHRAGASDPPPPWLARDPAARSLQAWRPYAEWLRGRASGGGDLFLFASPLPHAWLFPRCAGVLHHGGSGTTGAALHAGVPQCVAPMIFDQHTWAAAAAALGVAPPPLPFWWVFGDEPDDARGAAGAGGGGGELDAPPGAAGHLAASLADMLTPARSAAARRVAATLAAEADGAEVAAAAIQAHACGARRVPANAGAC